MFYALFFWVVITFIAPFTGVQSGRWFRSVALLGEIKQKGEWIRREARHIIRKGSRDYELSDKKVPRADFMINYWHAYHGRINEMTIKARNQNKEDMKHQMLTGMQFARISPAACLLFALSNISGTGVFEFIKSRDWKDQLRLDNHLSQFAEMKRREKVMEQLTPEQRKQHRKFPYNPSIMPSRDFPGLSVPERFRHSLLDITVLALVTVLLFMVCFLIFIRKKKA
jgi:hypothetical protein